MILGRVQDALVYNRHESNDLYCHNNIIYFQLFCHYFHPFLFLFRILVPLLLMKFLFEISFITMSTTMINSMTTTTTMATTTTKITTTIILMVLTSSMIIWIRCCCIHFWEWSKTMIFHQELIIFFS